MTHEKAADVVAYAKELFPVTSPARLDSLAALLVDFPNPQFAMQTLLTVSHESDVLPIPLIRERLEQEQGRQDSDAQARFEKAMKETKSRRTTEHAQREKASSSIAAVDALLGDFSPEDLVDLKADVLKTLKPAAHAFCVKLDPCKSLMLRSLIHQHLTAPTKPSPARRSGSMVAADFDIDDAGSIAS